MIKFVSISEAAKYLGVTPATIRRWELDGKILSSHRTSGNQRRYELAKLLPHRKIPQSDVQQLVGKTYAYARVSSQDQKADLERQKNMLEMYCAAHGLQFEIISDLGSGLNYHKRGLKKLLLAIFEGKMTRLVLTHKDRLLRFGAELIFALCELHNIEVVILNQEKNSTFEEELAQDVLEIITVFSARLYGSRSQKNKKLLKELKQVATQNA